MEARENNEVNSKTVMQTHHEGLETMSIAKPNLLVIKAKLKH